MTPEILDVSDDQARPGGVVGDLAERGQITAGKDVSLDPWVGRGGGHLADRV